MARFDEVHELAGFVSNEGGQASRLVSGQAFERQLEDERNAPKNFVTVVGRLDASLVLPFGPETPWPSSALKRLSIGLKVYDGPGSDDTPSPFFDVEPGMNGKPLVSLTQAYLSSVPSRASLRVTGLGLDKSSRVIWRSDDSGVSLSTTRLEGWWQRLADRWAKFFFLSWEFQTAPVSAEQALSIGGTTGARATLTSTPFLLPDLAARALVWVSGALAVIVFLSADWGIYTWRLRNIRGTAYAMAVRSTAAGNLKRFAAKDEMGTLARVFHILLTRSRSRDLSLVRRQRADELRRAERLRLDEAQVQNRKAMLDAIGHEIRAPLQSLLNTTKDQALAQQKLTRIRRAVEALHEATSVEDGLRSGEIAMSPHDLATWLSTFADNLMANKKGVLYVGPSSGVVAAIDSFILEQILDHLIDNAERYRTVGTDIELRLVLHANETTLSVFNQGPCIPEAELERIFDLGVSDSAVPANGGLGLFASRIYALAMRLTIHARNEDRGVALVLRFPQNSIVEVG